MASRWCACTVLVYLGFMPTVHADALDVANAIRRTGCDSRAGLREPLREDPRLNDLAERWTQGGRLRNYIPEGYGHVRFVSVHVGGVRADNQLAAALSEQLCEALTDASFTRFGAERRGDEYWIALSDAPDAPRTSDSGAIRLEALHLVNQARAQKRRCGTRSLAAAPALQLNAKLNRAAEQHARNMAQHRKLQHEGFDGSTPAQRATAAGYSWRNVGENIAAGPATAGEVVAMWLKSPGHCANIMSPEFTQMGLAFAEDRKRESGVYWAQEFGRPR
ncbi:MAG: CAP domain-containing protein [Steroidobacteraceae bacterium]